MKTISLIVFMDDDFGIEGVTIEDNECGLKIDSKLLKYLCISLLEAIDNNQEDLELYDELRDIGIVPPE
jgi:hypothetical protein